MVINGNIIVVVIVLMIAIVLFIVLPIFYSTSGKARDDGIGISNINNNVDRAVIISNSIVQNVDSNMIIMFKLTPIW